MTVLHQIVRRATRITNVVGHWPAAAVAIAVCGAVPAWSQQAEALRSPGGRIEVRLAAGADKHVTYEVFYDGKPLIVRSSIGVPALPTGGLSGNGPVTVERSTGIDLYSLPAAKVSRVEERYNQIILRTGSARPGQAGMAITVRAYDGGIAFRSNMDAMGGVLETSTAEATEFITTPEARCHASMLGRFNTGHETEFDPINATATRPLHLYDSPFVCADPAGSRAFAITEADLRDYPVMLLSGNRSGDPGVTIQLNRNDVPGQSSHSEKATSAQTPWRVVMIADSRGKLIENTLVTSLNRPAQADYSWVRPGKYAWDWWNGHALRAIPNVGMNTATMKAYVDFAAANKLAYMLIDDGWYLNSGQGAQILPGADVLREAPGLDLKAIIAHAKAGGVGVMLWMHWRMIDQDMDRVLAHYASLGIAGIKVDFMNRDDKGMVDFYNRLVEATSRHHLLLNLHGSYHPTGLYRTYPNFITQEGVLGAEFNKWSKRITARHNVTLAYTRMLVGPMDYTPGGFHNATPETFAAVNATPMVMTTRGQALAMYVVYDSPLVSVADSPDSYNDQPDGFDFVRSVPTTWDEVRFLGGEIDEHIVLARRKGKDWYIGAMTNEHARKVEIPLGFLGKGRYTATLWQDGATPLSVQRTTNIATASDVLTLNLAGSGGGVIALKAN